MGQHTSDDKLSRGHYDDFLALVMDWSLPCITYTFDYQTFQTAQDRNGVWCGFIALLLYKGTAYLNVLESMSSRPSQIQSRLDIIDKAVDWIAQSPLLGIGLGSYNYELRIIIHNTPIWFLTEFGLLGLIVYGGFMIWFFIVGIRSYRAADPIHRPIIMALLLSHAAMIGLSMGIEALFQRYWWFMMAMNGACIRLTDKNLKGEMPYRTQHVERSTGRKLRQRAEQPQ